MGGCSSQNDLKTLLLIEESSVDLFENVNAYPILLLDTLIAIDSPSNQSDTSHLHLSYYYNSYSKYISLSTIDVR